MKNKVIKCPATEYERGICICIVKCTGSYDADGNRIPVRKSLPYMGIARRARKNKTGFDKFFDKQMQDPEFCKGYEKQMKKIKDTLNKIDHEEALNTEEDK